MLKIPARNENEVVVVYFSRQIVLSLINTPLSSSFHTSFSFVKFLFPCFLYFLINCSRMKFEAIIVNVLVFLRDRFCSFVLEVRLFAPIKLQATPINLLATRLFFESNSSDVSRFMFIDLEFFFTDRLILFTWQSQETKNCLWLNLFAFNSDCPLDFFCL